MDNNPFCRLRNEEFARLAPQGDDLTRWKYQNYLRTGGRLTYLISWRCGAPLPAGWLDANLKKVTEYRLGWCTGNHENPICLPHRGLTLMPKAQPVAKPSDPRPSSGGGEPLRDNCYVTAVSHFYRGEIGRIMVWRQRLDLTTTWAITSTTTIITVAFSFREIPHLIFFFNLLIVWMMLWIEARRYRFYDAFRGRVRMLEAHFFVAMLARNPKLLGADWQKLVCEDLILPSFKISRLEALGRRLKRNYVFIFAIIIVAWMTKVFMHAKLPITSWSSFCGALAVGELPAWLVGLVLAGMVFSSAFLCWYAASRSDGEITDLQGTRREKWRI